MKELDINTGQVIAYSGDDVKSKFIRQTYTHLAGAILLFALIESVLIKIGLGDLAIRLLSGSGFLWLGVLLVYGFASSAIHGWAHKSLTKEQQYAALFAGVFLEALIFLPMIAMATTYAPEVLPNAAIVTLALVAGLTAIAFTTKKDFSFLAPALKIGFFIAIGLIIASIVFGFSLGIFFSGAMIVFAAGAILYETSKIMFHYNETQYVGAALSLFSSVGLLFWYVLQFMMSFSRD